MWFTLGVILLASVLLVWVWRTRQPSITGQKSQARYFAKLADKFGFRLVTDEYFIQLEGAWEERFCVIYPHNFEGPGIITLVYLSTNRLAIDRNWIEPNLSLGRAVVEWKKGSSFGYEITGKELSSNEIVPLIEKLQSQYPFISVTLPWRFSYSPLLQQTFKGWKNYVVLIALDVGRKPAREKMEQAMNDASAIAALVDQNSTFSDSTG
jgi:hypothetical protein